MKLCKDCKHASKAVMWSCAKTLDPVTGDEGECKAARSETGPCGPDAKLYEQRMNAKRISEEATIKPIGSMYTENDPDLMKHIKGKKLPRSDYTPDKDAE